RSLRRDQTRGHWAHQNGGYGICPAEYPGQCGVSGAHRHGDGGSFYAGTRQCRRTVHPIAETDATAGHARRSRRSGGVAVFGCRVLYHRAFHGRGRGAHDHLSGASALEIESSEVDTYRIRRELFTGPPVAVLSHPTCNAGCVVIRQLDSTLTWV